ncbi:hypothetical protein DL89DRAFT_310485 [Linderina pennispora]|uniref:Uncharacterized protein n=1 Tax=Linderina pennispora TaxID=61395 RepID=A0A1Y1VWY6_9FUNG|nr:uncharacterized protein DL89DRAFT_310485 [Linderina pennispora]ORX65723.1 hypothetical protein DL89DRAFT_310485 [Linderina pennispora]
MCFHLNVVVLFLNIIRISTKHHCTHTDGPSTMTKALQRGVTLSHTDHQSHPRTALMAGSRRPAALARQDQRAAAQAMAMKGRLGIATPVAKSQEQMKGRHPIEQESVLVAGKVKAPLPNELKGETILTGKPSTVESCQDNWTGKECMSRNHVLIYDAIIRYLMEILHKEFQIQADFQNEYRLNLTEYVQQSIDSSEFIKRDAELQCTLSKHWQELSNEKMENMYFL